MKQLSLLRRPGKHELMEKLRTEFCQDYSYRFSGFGSPKSIVVQKSPFIAVEISYRGEKNLMIKGTSASMLVASVIRSIYNRFGNAAHSTPSTKKSWKMLEDELAIFIISSFS